MKKYFFLSYFLLLFFANSFAQYRPVIAKICYYKAKDGNITAARVDSTKTLGNDSIFHISAIARVSTQPGCDVGPFSPNLSGSKIIFKPKGIAVFFNSAIDSIKINYSAPVNSTWLSCKFNSGDQLMATVNSIVKTNVLGLSDSVKTIHFQMQNSIGSNISSPVNQAILKIGKTNGLIELPDFYTLPSIVSSYTLTGMELPKVGNTNLTAKEIFDYSLNDEFHIETSEDGSSIYPTLHISTIKKVIAKKTSLNDDTLTYSFLRCEHYISQSSSFVIYKDTSYKDTITERIILSNYTFLDSLPTNWPIIQNTGANYNSRMTKIDVMLTWIVSPNCAIIFDIYPPSAADIYISGCGKYETVSHFGTPPNIKLMYFKKGNETWGTPYDCSTLLSVKNETENDNRIRVFPNPTHDFIFIRSENTLPVTTTIRDITGKILLISDKRTIDLSVFTPGFYLVETSTNKGRSVTRIVRQ